MEALMHDLRYGSRMTLRNRGFSVIVVIVLALGIGSVSSVFSVVNAVLLRPLPYENSDRIVTISANHKSIGRTPTSFADFAALRVRNRVFENVAAIMHQYFNLTEVDEPERVYGAKVSPDFFPLLTVAPMLGRNFLPEEDKLGARPAVILSYAIWHRRFGSNPDLIGNTIKLNNITYTVVGVMPRDLYFPFGADEELQETGHYSICDAS